MVDRLQNIVSTLIDLDEKEEVPSDLIQEYTLLYKNFSDENVVELVQSLGDLCREMSLREVFGKKEIINKLLEWSKQEKFQTPEFSLQLGRALGNLSYEHPNNRVLIDEEGGVEWVIKTLNVREEVPVKKVLCGALANLCDQTEKIQQKVIDSPSTLKSLILYCKDRKDIDLQKMSARALNNIVGNNVEYVEKIVELGAIDALLEIISDYESNQEIVLVEAINSLYTLSCHFKNGSDFIKNGSIMKVLHLLFVTDLSNELYESVTSFLVDLSENAQYKTLLANNQDFMKKVLEGLTQSTDENKRKNFSKIVSNLSVDDKNMSSLFEHLPSFINYLKSEDINAKVTGATVVGNLARSDENCRKLIDSGIVDLLIKNLSHEDVRLKAVSLGAIRNISIEPTNKPKLINAGIIPRLVECLKCENDHVKYGSIGTIKILSNGNPQVCTEFIEAGLYSALIPISLKTEEGHDPRVQYEAARIISIYSSIKALRFDLIQNGAIASQVALTKSEYIVLQHEGTKCLSEFASYGQFHEEILKADVIPRLIELAVQDKKDDSNNPGASLNPPYYSLLTLVLLSSTESCLKEIVSEAVVELRDKLLSLNEPTLVTELKSSNLLERLSSVTITKNEKLSKQKETDDSQSSKFKSTSIQNDDGDDSGRVLL